MVLPEDRDRKPRWRQGSPTRVGGRRSAEYDLYERDGDLVLSIEMPGFEREDIELRWDDGQVSVAADHEDERTERSREYRRSFRVPMEVDESAITARYRRGILDIFLPREPEETIRGTRIDVKS